MKKYTVFFIFLVLISCQEDKNYKTISESKFSTMTIKESLLNNNKVSVLKVGDSLTDEFPNILVKTKNPKGANYYLFEVESELENDSMLLSYESPFIFDDEDNPRKNGIWVYTKFYTEGTFPFTTNTIEFSVDSIPGNWKGTVPTKEGIYFYRGNSLILLSPEQSGRKYREKRWTGFYFFPNKGRLFDRLNINHLD